MFQEKGGFDVVIANPPYLKERDGKSVFDLVKGSRLGKLYHQGKMDYWFFFLHLAIDVAKRDGVISFITPRYWLNSAGSEKLISRVNSNLSFVDFVDTGSLRVFDNVVGRHMVATYLKNKARFSEFIYKQLHDGLTGISHTETSHQATIRLLRRNYVFAKPGRITVDTHSIEVNDIIQLGEISLISQGIVQSPDKVSARHAAEFNLKKGTGVFVINERKLTDLRLTTEEKFASSVFITLLIYVLIQFEAKRSSTCFT